MDEQDYSDGLDLCTNEAIWAVSHLCKVMYVERVNAMDKEICMSAADD